MHWAPRDQSVHADALTKSHFGEFDPEKRIMVSMQSLRWRMVPELLGAGGSLHSLIRQAKEQRSRNNDVAAQRRVKRKPTEALTNSDPWCDPPDFSFTALTARPEARPEIGRALHEPRLVSFQVGGERIWPPARTKAWCKAWRSDV